MDVGARKSLLAVLICTGVSCSSHDSRTEDLSRDEDHARSLISAMARRIAGLHIIVDIDGRVTYETMTGIPYYRILKPHTVTWIYQRMEQEKELFDLKKAAFTPITDTLRDANANWEVRVHLAILLVHLCKSPSDIRL